LYGYFCYGELYHVNRIKPEVIFSQSVSDGR